MDSNGTKLSKSPSLPGNESENEHGKLAQEIQDELLICKICLGNYKEPKSLSCLHTFCANCLESHIQGEVTYKKYSDYRDFTCPLCRKKTSLPIGGVKKLPDNFVVASLFDMIQKRTRSAAETNHTHESNINLTCQICKKMGHRRKEAQTKCIDCSKLMCRECTEMHKQTNVTKQHSLFDLNIEEDIMCKLHSDESVRFFCEPCQTCICVVCTFNEHREHDVTQFTEAVVKYKSEIENQRTACGNIILGFEETIDKIATVEGIIKETENEIKNMAVKLTLEIQNKEKQLLEEIRNIYGEQMLMMIKSKSLIEVKLCELRNACNMADMVLQRKDVEVLLLQREIQCKFSETRNLTRFELPLTVSKEVKFIPGIMDFGCIQDMDRPLLTKPRSYKEFIEQKDTHRPAILNTDTQTDPAITRPQSSKSTATTPIQKANKAVNTKSRIVQQKPRANSLQTLNASVGSFDEQPSIMPNDSNVQPSNSDHYQNTANPRTRIHNCDDVKSCDTKSLILTASNIITEYISNSNHDT